MCEASAQQDDVLAMNVLSDVTYRYLLVLVLCHMTANTDSLPPSCTDFLLTPVQFTHGFG